MSYENYAEDTDHSAMRDESLREQEKEKELDNEGSIMPRDFYRDRRTGDVVRDGRRLDLLDPDFVSVDGWECTWDHNRDLVGIELTMGNPLIKLPAFLCIHCGRVFVEDGYWHRLRHEGSVPEGWAIEQIKRDKKARQVYELGACIIRTNAPKDIHCNFCNGKLGAVETQKHSNPNFAEYRTCLNCGYQWAKEYWKWLAEQQGVKA
jgi:hypothetical protein